MADTELRPPPREPSFVRPLEAASHRRSRASHDSAAASTRSWVIMNQQSPPPPVEPIPVPEPVPALAARPLPQPPRRVELQGAEHMSVDLPSASAADLGYHWTSPGPGPAKKEGKGFVGGFVSGLRRLPRALRSRRPRRGTTLTEGTEGTEGTGMTGNTLPRYVSTPPTPVAADARVAFVRPGPQAVRENEEGGRRRRHPSFLVMPPEEDGQQGMPTPVVYDDPEGHENAEVLPGTFDLPSAPLENPYDHDTRVAPPPAISPHPSRADDRLTVPTGGDGDEPVSVHAHPLPTDDYRRMSAQDVAQPHSRTTITSASFSAASPSFSSELNGFHRFFNALHLLPWVATDRVTVDYHPKHKPATGESWYHPPGAAAAAFPADTPHHHPALDASPSRASAGSSPRAPQRHRTHHRRAATAPTPPTPPYAYPFAYSYYPAFSPPGPPQTPPRRPAHAHTHTRAHSPRANRHHRRSTSPAPWVPPPVPLPTPLYVIQASPAAGAPPDLSPPHTHTDSPAKLLAPVYMQIRGGNGGGGGGAFWPAEYAFAYSSPVAMPAPAQTGHGE